MKFRHCLPALLAILLGTAPAAAEDSINIAGTQAIESDYGSARGWRVFSGRLGGDAFYCAAEKMDRGAAFRIGVTLVGREGRQWMIAVPIRTRRDDYGSIEIDDHVSGAPFEQSGDWSAVWLHMGHVDAIRNGNTIIIDAGKVSIDHSLAGSAAAILKIEECFNNGGNPPVRAVARASATPAPRGSGAAWAPDMDVAIGTSVSATCDAITAEPHPCKVKRLKKNKRFAYRWRIDDVTGVHMSYRVALRKNGRVVVAVKFDPQGKWTNVGPFKPKPGDPGCFVPVPTKNKKAMENRGQDAWEFCVRGNGNPGVERVAQAPATPAPRGSGAAWAPDMDVAIGTSVSATCDAITAEPHPCKVKRLKKNKRFAYRWRIDDVTGVHMSYRVALRKNGRVIVAVKFDPQGKWTNVGPFKPKPGDPGCFVPVPTKNKKAMENRGQDAWEFCVR